MKREVEQQVAAFAPKPPVRSVVRKRQAATGKCDSTSVASAETATMSAAKPPALVTTGTNLIEVSRTAQRRPAPLIGSLSPERCKMQITISRDTHDKLRRVQDLLRHVVPNGDPAAIFERASRYYWTISSDEHWRVSIGCIKARQRILRAVTCRRQLGGTYGRAAGCG
jgi:hypothetical protein